jgi:hypothetical protein
MGIPKFDRVTWAQWGGGAEERKPGIPVFYKRAGQRNVKCEPQGGAVAANARCFAQSPCPLDEAFTWH